MDPPTMSAMSRPNAANRPAFTVSSVVKTLVLSTERNHSQSV